MKMMKLKILGATEKMKKNLELNVSRQIRSENVTLCGLRQQCNAYALPPLNGYVPFSLCLVCAK